MSLVNMVKIILLSFSPFLLYIFGPFLNFFKLKSYDKSHIISITCLAISFVFSMLFTGFTPRIGIFYLTVFAILNIEKKIRLNTIIIFGLYTGFKFLSLKINLSQYVSASDGVFLYDKTIPDMTILLYLYFKDKVKLTQIFALGLMALISFHLALCTVLLLYTIFNVRHNFISGAIISLVTPVASILFGDSLIGTSLYARYRGWERISQFWSEHWWNILIPGPYSGAREDFFWAGDLGILGSFYEFGLVVHLLIFGTIFLIIRLCETSFTTDQRLLLGYVTLGYIGRVSTQIFLI